MGFFAWPYRVLYQDTMAAGWHHFLTNFKFQCEAREHFLFRHILDTPEARSEFEDILLSDARGIQPQSGGGEGRRHRRDPDVPRGCDAIHMLSCFRVVRRDGVPVACGFPAAGMHVGQDRRRRPGTGKYAPPRAHTTREAPIAPSFHDRVVSGLGLTSLFDEEVIRLAQAVAAQEREGPLPAPPPLSSGSRNRLVFLFPGTGDFQPELLAEVARMTESATRLRRADDIVGSALGVPLTPLIEGSETHRIPACPSGIGAGGHLPCRCPRRPRASRSRRDACPARRSLCRRNCGTRRRRRFFLRNRNGGHRTACSRSGAVRGEGMIALLCPVKRAHTLIQCLGVLARRGGREPRRSMRRVRQAR